MKYEDILSLVLAKSGGSGGGGSSDFSTASVTVIGNSVENFFDIPIIYMNLVPLTFFVVPANETQTATVILYKNKALLEGWQEDMLSCTGNIEFDSDLNGWLISGDCTITVLD